MLARLAFAIALAAALLPGQSLTAPAQANAGSDLTIGWSGTDSGRDFISIVPVGEREGAYAQYKYLSSGNPVELTAPDRAGSYEVRWLRGGNGYPTAAKRPLTVLAVAATLDAPSQIAAGAPLEVRWTGPGNPRDFITVVEKGAPEKRYAHYVYAKAGNPAKLTAPDQAGEYEIRYLSGQEYLTVEARALTVGGVSAALEGPTSPAAGESIAIRWTGPGNERDFITIVPAGAPEKSYEKYVYTKGGNPAQMQAPDKPGAYEIRYLTGQDYRTIATLKITVGATSASLDAPAQVVGGRVPFAVSWTGPNHRGDFVTIVKKGEPDRSYGNYVYTYRGNPAQLASPTEPGEYELRYLTGQDYRTLAARPIRVTPGAAQTGFLKVVAPAAGPSPAAPAGGAVEIVLDASGSMLQRQGSERRIDIAKRTLTALTQQTIPAGTPFALRVFGHKEAGSCRTDLEMPAAPLDPAVAALKIGSIQAMNLAKTPIAASLAAVLQDLRGRAGEKVVVLITDGEETCDGDPAATIETLRAAGVDVRVNIVGFAVDDEGLKGKFRYWAELGGGGYFDAANAEQLGASLTQAVQAPFDVYDAKGQIIATGVVAGDAVEVPAGVYVVRTRTTPARTAAGIQVQPGETKTVTMQ